LPPQNNFLALPKEGAAPIFLWTTRCCVRRLDFVTTFPKRQTGRLSFWIIRRGAAHPVILKDACAAFFCNLRRGHAMRYWEIIADNLSKAGWSWGCVSAIDSEGRTIWITDAHRDDGKRFVVRADEKLTAFVELESSDSCALE
jgi:hypothetical protein